MGGWSDGIEEAVTVAEDLGFLSVKNVRAGTSVKHLWKYTIDGVVFIFGLFLFVSLFVWGFEPNMTTGFQLVCVAPCIL